ncbi:MAG: hypothetical protein K2L22_11655 [Muribaculaceae bacterium]|nr:hypothetical protein [Muribaculaceae bacterium]
MKSKLIKSVLSIFFGTLVLSLFSVDSRADNGSSSGGDALLTQQVTNPLRKRMPSRDYLEVMYENGVLSLSSNSYEGNFSLSFINIESGESHEVPSIFVGETISIFLPCGEYEVSAMGSDGLVLHGFMQVF